MNDLVTQSSRPIRLADYAPPPFRITAIDLRFELGEDRCDVVSQLTIERHPDGAVAERSLYLDGQELELISIELDDEPLADTRYALDAEGLTLHQVPEAFSLRIRTRIEPQKNTALEGLYRSGDMFCTQCEAQGFRRITFYQDRPDILAKFTTTIVAEHQRYPILLSNGNPVDNGRDGEKHWVTWVDPFPKPSYLFALVAGDLACHRDHFVTSSGKNVDLRIYVEPHNLDKCAHAMASLIKAMRWDEEVFGLEYDLDIYMIVAVDHFNMGAMENKGLNIFNSKYVLASPESATDTDFANIEAVIAHEYFHNWTGNRVTCRDWFQLSLKEGLTVFRDQEFSADMGSRAVTRIGDVRILRSAQFKEDAGPMAHPIRPNEYLEINNFYTVTIYNKGAEVIRMIHRLLGMEKFRRGMDLYFERHDGEAVTTDDFVQAMQDASGVDLAQFRRWYNQAGTPTINVTEHFDAAASQYTVTFRQSCAETPDGSPKLPFHIPMEVGLISETGAPIACTLANGSNREPRATHALELVAAEESFTFANVQTRPVASLLRGFSAPVRIGLERRTEDLRILVANDADLFNRWDAAQELALVELDELISAGPAAHHTLARGDLIEAFRALLSDASLDRAFVAAALSLPSESYVADRYDPIDVDGIHAAREHLVTAIAAALEQVLWETFTSCQSNSPYAYSAEQAATRSLKNACLGYLVHTENPQARTVCLDQLKSFENMTDAFAALSALAATSHPERSEALSAFEQRWAHDSLVMDKWLATQALSGGANALEQVQALMEHPAFDLHNPNRVRSLLGTFFHHNQTGFHRADGGGYQFLGKILGELDALNPQVTARLAGAFAQWRRFDAGRQALMKTEMENLLEQPGLSRDTLEILLKTMA